MSEHPVVAAKASVMLYDDGDKKWIPGGSSPGIAKVNIYHHSGSNAFRVVGRKLQDHEVVVNCAIFVGLKYNKATPTFHQWRDSKQVYGLNFISKDDADRFAEAMNSALDSLSAVKQIQKMSASIGAGDISTSSLSTQNGANQPQNMCNSVSGSTPVTSGECINSAANHFSNTGTLNGTMDASGQDQIRLGQPPTREEYRSHKRQSSAGRVLDHATASLVDNAMTYSTGSNLNHQSGASAGELSVNIPQAPPPPPKAPPPPAAPPLPASFTAPRNSTGRQGPAIPAKSSGTPPVGGASQISTGATGGGKAPVAPPTPPPINSLANALKSAQLKKVSKEETESGMPVGGVAGRSASISSPLSADIMSEMARKLKDRRARADGGTVNEVEDQVNSTDGATVSIRSANSAVDSPRIDRAKRFQSLTGQETFHSSPVSSSSSAATSLSRPATQADVEALKQDIIAETRRAILAAKQEIIDVIRTEMARK